MDSKLDSNITTLSMNTDSKLVAIGSLMDTKLGLMSGEIKEISSTIDKLHKYVTACNTNMDKVYKLVESMNKAVQVAH